MIGRDVDRGRGQISDGGARPGRSERMRRCLVLAAVVAGVSMVWTLVLPRISRTPEMRRWIERNERLGIDAGAMVYTEVGDRVEGIRLHRRGGKLVSETFVINEGQAFSRDCTAQP
jgi:hypothetical protein